MDAAPASPAAPPILEARGLTRRFGAITAVDGVDLAVPPGTVTGVLGPNGSGKSTFLRMLIGLVRPHAGSATVAGERLAGDGTAIRRRVTFAPGEIALYGELVADEQLTWLLRGRGRVALDRARALAGELGLPLDKRVHAYSHGMKRQLLFCAALGPASGPDAATRVPLVILDEPTEGLDPTKRREVLEHIDALRAAGGTVLLSSHHLGEVEAVCDRLVFFHGGRILSDASPDALRARARRSLRIAYGAEAEAAVVEAALVDHPAVADLAREGALLRLELVDEDPRPFLAAFAGLDAPAPTRLASGHLSLTDLYRTVYGVSGL